MSSSHMSFNKPRCELFKQLVSCGRHFDSQCSTSVGFDPASDGGGAAILEPPITNTVEFSLFDQSLKDHEQVV